MVRVKDYIPDIRIDLKYAGADNFLGRPIYTYEDAWLRYGTVKKLTAAQEAVKARGFSLKIWDAWRDPAAQFLMWELMPNDDYVADPYKGFSKHSRGNTVDVTLVDLSTGQEVEMPSEFDDFSERANRDYSQASVAARSNVLFLEETMKNAGFNAYFGEWWHFHDKKVYDIVESIFAEDSYAQS